MTRKSRIHRGTRKSTPLSLHPAARAIRQAIAAGIAIAIAGPAFAGACDISDPSNAVCEGFFARTIGYSIDSGLDLRVGGDIFTQVAPAAGSVGIELYSAYGSLALSSSAHVRTSYASAIAVFAPNGDVDVANSGTVSASAGDGIDAYSIHGDVAVANSGSIGSYGGNFARGVNAASALGAASFANSGTIDARAGTSYGNAAAYGASVHGYQAGLSNEGSISASGYSLYGNGFAIASDVDGYAAATTNNGTLHGDFHADTGGAAAIGAGNSATGASTVDNGGGGQISASASVCFGRSNAYGVFASGNAVAVTNAGSITADAQADRGLAYAHGIFANGPYGTSTTRNSGTIGASANVTGSYGNAFAFGAETVGSGYASTTNSGSMGATADADAGGYRGFARAMGAHTSALYVGQDNSGSIGASANVGLGGVAYAFGSYAAGKYGVTDRNTGSISASATTDQGFANARGLYDRSYMRDVSTSSTGSIAATARALGDSATGYGGIAYAYGARSYGKYHTQVANSGSISAFSDAPYGIAHATGVSMDSHLGSTLSNSGAIGATAHADRYFAQAIGANVNSRDNAVTINDGTITGAAYADFGNAAAYGSGTATWGIHGVAYLDNRGGIGATSGAYAGTARATGAKVLGIVAGGIHNSGGIGAYASASQGLAIATGAKAYAFYNDATVANEGAIAAQATGGQAFAYGSVALGSYRATTSNATGHAIGASASSAGAGGKALAIGSLTLGSIASIENHGSIVASASADLGDAKAYGASLTGDFAAYGNAARYFYSSTHNVDSHAFNDGSIVAYAQAANGSAMAIGLRAASAYGDVAVANAGGIDAVAIGGSGVATGLAVASTGNATIDNVGEITARFDGGAGSAQGVAIVASGEVAFTNGGSIGAMSSGDATGIRIDGAGPVAFDNTGSILADAGGDAAAVRFVGAGPVALTNSGSIVAVSASGGRIAVMAGDAALSIDNSGLLDGAVVAGNGGNTLVNGASGSWNASGTASSFGDGDDAIANTGTLRFADASIDLGGSVLGNAFANTGRILVSGSSRIGMGEANAIPFANDGSIEMRNGVAGDVLAIAGDWSGSGRIGVDAATRAGSADVLRISGSVVAGSITRVDVNLFDAPKSALESVPVVEVAGDATSGSFVLGDVHFDTARSFLTATAVDLVGSIDATNANPDVFSVDVAVTGLSDSGALASAFVPGVQSLMGSEIGTWRERMGVIGRFAKGGVGAWARAFQDSGTVHPAHQAENFGQGGSVAFNQQNSGQELGVDVAISDAFSLGLMLGKAHAGQHLAAGGIGRTAISGDTRGLYGTWLSPEGFHLDLSYRQMDLDARLDAAAGESRASGRARAFNVEMGKGWELADGLTIEPQVQYTRTSVGRFSALSGALSGFGAEGGDSSRLRVGAMVDRSIKGPGGAEWTPYASVNLVREFDGNSAWTIDQVFSGSTSVGGTSALVEGGLDVRVGRMSVFAGATWQDGGAIGSFLGSQLGLRYSW